MRLQIRRAEHALNVLTVLQEGVPAGVALEGALAPADEKSPSCSRQANVEPPLVAQEADAACPVGAHA